MCEEVCLVQLDDQRAHILQEIVDRVDPAANAWRVDDALERFDARKREPLRPGHSARHLERLGVGSAACPAAIRADLE